MNAESLEQVVLRVMADSEHIEREDGEAYTNHAIRLAADLAVAMMRWANERERHD